MKRDMELVRAILTATEAADGPYSPSELVSCGWPVQAIAYHVELLSAHGLVDARVNRYKGGASLTVLGLTWEGCDYLDAIRDERVWEETTRAIAESVGSATMAVVKTTAVKVMKRLIDAAI